MLTVAVGTYGRIGFTAGDQFAVDAFPEVFFYVLMALTTGFGNVEVINRRFRVAGA